MKTQRILFLLLGLSGSGLFSSHGAIASDRQFPFDRNAQRPFEATRPFPSNFQTRVDEMLARMDAEMNTHSFSAAMMERLHTLGTMDDGIHRRFEPMSERVIFTDIPNFHGNDAPSAALRAALRVGPIHRPDLLSNPPRQDLQAQPPLVSTQPLQPGGSLVDLKAIDEALKSRGLKSPETLIATYTATLASQKPQQDFFGFDIRDQGCKTDFQKRLESLTQRGLGDNPLLKDWIHQSCSAIQLAGFLNSFGDTLPLADPALVGSTLPPTQSVNPVAVLDKAYVDMARLISGQTVAIDEHRKATTAEERVLIQAAKNLGRKKALELDYLRREGIFQESVTDALVSDYNLHNPFSLNKTTLRHNAILLSLSLSAALERDLSRKDLEIETLLRKKGFSLDVLQEVDAYRDYVYRTFSLLRPSKTLEGIISGHLTVYSVAAKSESMKALAAQALKGVETLGIDPVFIYEKLTPYGKPAFEALSNPRRFIDAIRKESQTYPLSEVRAQYFRTMLQEMESALVRPAQIHTIHGFGYGSVAKEGKTQVDEQRHELLTKRTWLSSCHDFILAYYYAKTNDCLAEFYADATPPENAPCLPGKIRSAQEWFESRTMLVNDTAGLLEKVFAGMAGIELASAVQQLYRKYVWAYLEIYRAEKGGIPAAEAKKQDEFKKEYLTLRAIQEGLVDMVSANLPAVIRKYRFNRSSRFPIAAFHSYKYGNLRLQDGLGVDDNGLTNGQEIMRIQAQANQDLLDVVGCLVESLSEQKAIEIYRPSGLMSFGY